MKLKKIVGLFVGIAVVAAMSVTAFARDFDLGNPTHDNGNPTNCMGWGTDGFLEVATPFLMEDFQGHSHFVLEVSNPFEGGIAFITSADGNDWAWDETYVNADGMTTVVIALSEMKGWNAVMTGEHAYILLAYWGDSWANMGVKSVVLTNNPPGAAEAPAAQAPAAEAPAAADSAPAGAKDPGSPVTGSGSLILVFALLAVSGVGFFAVRNRK